MLRSLMIAATALTLTVAAVPAAYAGVTKTKIVKIDGLGDKFVKVKVMKTDGLGDKVVKVKITKTDPFGDKITKVKVVVHHS